MNFACCSVLMSMTTQNAGKLKKNQQFAISLVNDNLALFSDAYRQKRSEFDI